MQCAMTDSIQLTESDSASLFIFLVRQEWDKLRQKLLNNPSWLNAQTRINGTCAGTLLQVADRAQAIDVIAEVASQCGVELEMDASSDEHMTPLFAAIGAGNVGLADALLRHGANPNGVGGFLPLNAAMGLPWSVQAVNLLLSHGAHPDGPPEGLHEQIEQGAPLFSAAKVGDSEAALALLAAGANCHLMHKGMTPSETAKSLGHPFTAAAIDAWIRANEAKDLISQIQSSASARRAAQS